MTNKKFAQTNREFQLACEIANIKPTGRQASKYRGGSKKRGLAALYRIEANQRIRAEEAQKKAEEKGGENQ